MHEFGIAVPQEPVVAHVRVAVVELDVHGQPEAADLAGVQARSDGEPVRTVLSVHADHVLTRVGDPQETGRRVDGDAARIVHPVRRVRVADSPGPQERAVRRELLEPVVPGVRAPDIARRRVDRDVADLGEAAGHRRLRGIRVGVQEDAVRVVLEEAEVPVVGNPDVAPVVDRQLPAAVGVLSGPAALGAPVGERRPPQIELLDLRALGVHHVHPSVVPVDREPAQVAREPADRPDPAGLAEVAEPRAVRREDVHHPAVGVGHVHVAVRVGVEAVQLDAELAGAGALRPPARHERAAVVQVVLHDFREVRVVGRGDVQPSSVHVGPHPVAGVDVDLVQVGAVLVVVGQVALVEVGVAELRDVDAAVAVVDLDRVRLALVERRRPVEGADLVAAVGVVAPDLVVPVVAHEHLVGDRVVLHAPRVHTGLAGARDRAHEARDVPGGGARRMQCRRGHQSAQGSEGGDEDPGGRSHGEAQSTVRSARKAIRPKVPGADQ